MNRSFLFAPGNVARRVEKAFTLAADAVILDLEDSVAVSDKVATRKQVVDALGRKGRARVYVRVNAPSTSFCHGDLMETVQRGIEGIVVPKIESAADLHAIDWVMAALERERDIPEGSLDLMPLIETAAGVQRVDRVLQARNLRPYRGAWRVKRVAFGAADYANDVGLMPTLEEAELAGARERVVLASRAAGMENPIDSPWFHFKETEAFQRALERSRRSGFQGRLCVHPDQLAPVNKAYLPTDEELERARRIVAAFREAEARGEAAVQVDGLMVDYPIVHRAQAVLDAMEKK